MVGGVHGLCCLDAYNGRKLWEQPLKELLSDYDGIHHDAGIGDTGGPFCMGGDSVYVRTGSAACGSNSPQVGCCGNSRPR